MNWRTFGAIQQQKTGNYTYRSVCNGNCLKEHHSIPVRNMVDSGDRCHNPRCSGVHPTFTWEKNEKLYCSVECCDGYQEWAKEWKAKVSLLYSLPYFFTKLLKGKGGFSFFRWVSSKLFFTLLLWSITNRIDSIQKARGCCDLHRSPFQKRGPFLQTHADRNQRGQSLWDSKSTNRRYLCRILGPDY
jgi:hypothetical protein